jgi:hypothetical protein
VNLATAGLAILPPALALVVEAFNPISERVLRRSAETDLAPFLKDHPELVNVSTTSMGAAVEISGLAPTLVSTITSGFAILYEVPAPYGYFAAILYTIVFVLLTIFILRMLGGVSFLGMGSESYIIRWRGQEKRLKANRTGVVRRIIYFANVLLIIACIAVYAISQRLSDQSEHGSSPQTLHTSDLLKSMIIECV